MIALALATLRRRSGAFLATFLSAALGATLLTAFASQLDAAAGADATSAANLATTAGVAGGWCLLIVVFAVASTMTLSVRQRSAEVDLLRSAGATPRQVRRMIVAEAAAVGLAGAAVAVLPGLLLGRALFGLLRDTGQVAPGVQHRFGAYAVAAGFGVTLLGALVAGWLAARRSTRAPDTARSGRGRTAAAVAFLAAGAACGTLTATVMKGRGIDAMQTAGQAGIWTALGLALLAPRLLRATAAVLDRPLRRGAAGELALVHLRSRPSQPAGALMPIVLFTGITTGTVFMQAVEDAAAAGAVPDDLARSLRTLNYVVAGMIAVFAAIMLVNTLLAATAHRRREFGQQRLAGATRAQVLRTVAVEALALAGTGVLAGTAASLVTILPFGFARTGEPWPGVALWPYPVIVAAAVVLTLAACLGAARRALAGPAVDAVRA